MQKKISAISYNSHDVSKIAGNAAKRLVWFLGTHAFLIILVLILAGVLFGEFLFYQYVIFAERQDVENAITTTTFKENAYQNILQEWEAREEILSSKTSQLYVSPFR